MGADAKADGTPKKSWFGARVLSIAALGATVGAVGYVARTAYFVATDSFVVPVVLSPDSDLVIQSKLSRSALLAEQMRATTRKAEIEADLEAGEQAIEQLKALHAAASKALEWTSSTNVTQVNQSAGERRALARQREELKAMVAAQEVLVDRVRGDLDAGLASKTDYAREQNALGQLRVAVIDNERAQIVTESQMSQLAMSERALRGPRDGGGLATPEMLGQKDQLVRIQCDLLKLQAEQRSKTMERRQIKEELAKLDDLIGQLNRRPIFRAIDASTNVAFVPYSQLDGVGHGGAVYECVWGMFSCTAVGRVTEVLPGEVIVPDPWGTLARGQYAVIELDDQHAAQSKTLRVRSRATATPVKAPEPPPRVANK